jgi:phosphate transport system permease protein
MAKAPRNRDVHAGDRIFAGTVRGLSFAIAGLLFLIAGFLLIRSQAAFHKFGLSFLYTSVWDPVQEQYGALPVIFGTIVSSSIAVLISAPLSVGIALFLNEIAPRRVSEAVGFLVQMLAAIPSVVYGLWGVFVLAPWLRTTVEPALGKTLGFLPFFQGPPFGVGMLAAGIILSIMITPTISAISREVFSAVPRGQREAALALGATRWEMMQLSVLRASRPGVIGAIILGLGRALGETMAVTMVIGNRAAISPSLFAPSQTMASVLANEYAEATSDMHLSALAAIGFVLFLVTFVLNSLARVLVWRMTRLKGAR